MIQKVENLSVKEMGKQEFDPEPPYAKSASKTKTYYESYVADPVAFLIRPLFFPLFNKMTEHVEDILGKEKKFFKDFWDPKAPLFPELSHHKAIRDNFTLKNQEFTVNIRGEEYTVKCAVIESKEATLKGKCCNIVHSLGIHCTIDNTIMHTYPLLASYLDEEGEKPPARFIMINQYSIYTKDGEVYKHNGLTEAGLILSELLKALEEKYGTIDQLLSHSLGGIVTAAALKFFHKEAGKEPRAASFYDNAMYYLIGRVTPAEDDSQTLKATRAFKRLPRNIVFDRVPSSIANLSNRYTGGSILLPLARLTDWDADIGNSIDEFVQRCEGEAPNIAVVSALRDHRFLGEVNLCFHPKIEKLTKENKITTLVLDMTLQSLHENAQHSLSLGSWYGSHLVEGYKEQSFLPREKSLSSSIVKSSISS